MSTPRVSTADTDSRIGAAPARFAALLSALVLTGAMTVLGAPAAQAHDLLLSSSPEDGESLDAAPDELVLSFNNEPLEQGAAVEITDADGEVIAEGEPTYAGLDVVFDLPDLAPGSYDVSWTVVSSDGHRIGDEPPLSFTVEAAAEDEPADEATSTEDETGAAPEDTTTTDESQANPDENPAVEPTDDADTPPAAGPPEGELAEDEPVEDEPSTAWRVIAVIAAAGAVAAVVVALAVRMRRQQRDQKDD